MKSVSWNGRAALGDNAGVRKGRRPAITRRRTGGCRTPLNDEPKRLRIEGLSAFARIIASAFTRTAAPERFHTDIAETPSTRADRTSGRPPDPRCLNRRRSWVEAVSPQPVEHLPEAACEPT